MTSTPGPINGGATLDKPLMVPLGIIELRFQSVCKWTRHGARCLAHGTAFNNFHNAVLIGGLAGFEPQRQSTSTPHVACVALHIMYHGTRARSKVQLAAAVCLHTAVAFELSAGMRGPLD